MDFFFYVDKRRKIVREVNEKIVAVIAVVMKFDRSEFRMRRFI